MNCNILQIISLKFVHNGDYQKSYYFFLSQNDETVIYVRSANKELHFDRLRCTY